MEQRRKRRTYESPKLHSISAIEAGSALCCKSTPWTCTRAAKTGSGKGRRVKTPT